MIGAGTTTEHGQWNEDNGTVVRHDAASKPCAANATGTSMSGASSAGGFRTGFCVVSLAPPA